MLALGLDVVVGNQVQLLYQTYFSTQREHVRTEICLDAYKSSPEHLLVYLKLQIFLLLLLRYMTTSTFSSACKHVVLPLYMLLYRNSRTGTADCMFRGELLCLTVVHRGAVLGKDWDVRKKRHWVNPANIPLIIHKAAWQKPINSL